MENIRSFIAIEISDLLKYNLLILLKELRYSEADVKWVRAEGIHLTLKFLGSVNQESLERISLLIRPVVERIEPFEMRALGLGCFPSIRNPRVVWVGLEEGGRKASVLQREIESKTAELGFSPEDRPFKPHLTLGRVRSPKGKSTLVQMIEKNSQIDLGSFLVDKVFLFRSDLRPEGAVYTKLQEFPMKKV